MEPTSNTTTFTSSVSIERESLANRPVGYLVVEDCDVYVPDDHQQSEFVEVPLLPHERGLRQSHRNYFINPFKKDDVAKPHQIRQKQAAVENCAAGGPCHHCDLVLERIVDDNDGQHEDVHNDGGVGGGGKGPAEQQEQKQSAPPKKFPAPTLRFPVDNVGPRFDGSIKDTKSNSVRCQCSNKTRSDAVLLVGTALSGHDLEHIQVQSIQVWFLSSAVPSTVASTRTGNRLVKKRAAAVLVTFSIKEIIRQPPKTVACLIKEEDPMMALSNKYRPAALRKKEKEKSSTAKQPVIVQGPKRRFFSNTNRTLPASTQLIMSLMSCDWERLNEKISSWTTGHCSSSLPGSEGNRTTASVKKEKVSMFPSEMTLAAVYRRIGAASFSSGYVLDSSVVGGSTSIGNDEDIVSLSRLPPDVLCHHLGPFLKARTLDSLRCTCKRLHYTMRAVVPGLKLKLFSHQSRSLYWMRMREARLITERDLLVGTSALSSLKNENNDGDLHRAASGGATCSVRPRPRKTDDSLIVRQPVVRMSQESGDEMIVDMKDPLSRTLSRGGLLCDDPGLGKTITVLSLILQTMGLSASEKFAAPVDELSDEQIFAEYWREQMIPEIRQEDMLKLYHSFMKSSAEVYYFFDEPEKLATVKKDYLHDVSNPICLKDVKVRVGSGFYNDSGSFAVFESDVLRVFKNAMEYSEPTDVWHMAAKRLTYSFKDIVREFKENKARIAKKSFSSPKAKPDSSVAVLVERNNKAELFKSLIMSKSTLLVVPSVLIDHWLEQIELHVDPQYCIDKPWQKAITFIYNGSVNQRRRMKEVVEKVQDQSHCPYIFVDKAGSKALPPPEFLALFRIVVTSNHRFSTEWKNGSFEAELKRNNSYHRDRNEGHYSDNDYLRVRRHLAQSDESCPLLKVNWLRMIVDEGHSMSKERNSSILFASWINAERRWATTGTPTPENKHQNGLSNLLHLTEYLQHDFFSHHKGGDSSWTSLIARPWHRGNLSAFYRVQSLLSLLMVRHTKADVLELPQPKRNTVLVPMSPEEVTAYNTLVCAVQSNLLITSMEGAKTSGAQDSLLHKSQREHAKTALRNIRLVCVGGTQVRPTLSDKNCRESLTEFHACNEDPKARKDFAQFLSRTASGELSKCDCCQVMLSILLVCPCGHYVCFECMDSSTNSCAVCDAVFDVDKFQRLQPGFEFQWLHNIEQEGSASPEGVSNANAPNFAGGMNANGFIGFHFRHDDRHVCKYDPTKSDGRCLLCRKEHDECYLVKTRTCPTCHRTAEDCPSYESKSFYLTDKLSKLHELQEASKHSRRNFFVPNEYEGMGTKRPLKAIVFSQFRQQLNMIGHRLIRRFGPGCVAEFWGSYRRQELHKFTSDPNCFVLLLSSDGSEGLDLSFVTHIWFLESLWDRSLQSQVEGRAWRMGATESVCVETLLAESSIEVTMESYEKLTVKPECLDTMQSTVASNSKHSQARINYLLTSLKLVTNSATLGFAASEDRAGRGVVDQNTEELEEVPARKRQRRDGEHRSNVRFQDDSEVGVNMN